jgi:iron(III) transport system ATP-binding protein
LNLIKKGVHKNMAEVKLQNITVKYDEITAIEDFSLTVKDGECFTILGPSPCGKTTILRSICGFEKPVDGDIYIDDKLVSSKNKKKFVAPEKRNIGVVFQDYAVWPHKTAYENIYYPLKKKKVDKKKARERTMKMLGQVRMADYADRLPAQLSGGQQQRIALARALVSSQKLMLLDEPLSNLDANLREEMRFEIKELQRKNRITIIYVTHDQDVALAISDRIAVLDNKGKIRQIGGPEEIYRNPVDSYVYQFLGLSNFIELHRNSGKYYVGNSDTVFPYELPDNKKEKTVYCACRPLNIKLTRAGKIKGIIKRVIFLSNIFEYRVLLGDKEIRVQQDSYDAFNNIIFQEGDTCGIEIEDLRYYSHVEEV